MGGKGTYSDISLIHRIVFVCWVKISIFYCFSGTQRLALNLQVGLKYIYFWG